MATLITSRLVTRPARAFVMGAWAVLGWNLLVILWGAFVRASGSGAGCGGHWPLCNGQVLPPSYQAATLIEYAHRATSGIALIGVLGLALWARRVFPKGHRARTASALAVLFIITEALLGAGLVLFDYVAQNASAGRAVYLSLHLANTQLLLAALAISGWFAAHPNAKPNRQFVPALVALPVAVGVSITGVIAALGDTLFPATSLAAGLRQDFSPAVALLVRLRVIHPALAIVSGAFFIYVALSALRARPGQGTQRTVWCVLVLVLAQLCAGAVNIALLAPVWMQLLHLLLADLLWIALLALALHTATQTSEPLVLRSQVA
jgi:cytochrome c oxidase assembly protein subunit 15